MKKAKFLASIVMLVIILGGFMLVGDAVHADCDAGTGAADNITCDDDVPNPDQDLDAGDGNDSVTIDGNATVEDSGDAGDNAVEGGNGDDTIINNGSIDGDLEGDGGATTGNDSIVNNGTVTDEIETGQGNDTILNGSTGVVRSDIEGDEGEDSITNDGTVRGDIDAGDGNDTVINNGTVREDVHGQDGDDSLINNGLIREDFEGDDPPSGDSGNDTMINNGTVVQDMRGGEGNDSVVNNELVVGTQTGGEGNDIVENNGTVECIQGGGIGDDVITNNGVVVCAMLGRDGDDFLTNNGTTGFMVGDFDPVQGGNDTIVNNGVVDNGLRGDDSCFGGDDLIINNGSAGFIEGDDSCTDAGSDTIFHTGTVGDIWADQQGLVQGEGNDEVFIQWTARVTGVIRGGEDVAGGDTDFDVITFTDLSEELAAAIATACPDPDAGCIINISGVRYDVAEFESLQLLLAAIIEQLGGYLPVPTVICDDGNVKIIRDIFNNQWVYSGFNLLPPDGFMVAFMPYDELFPGNVFSNPGAEIMGWTAVLDNTLHTRVFDAAGNLVSDTCLYRDEPNPGLTGG